MSRASGTRRALWLAFLAPLALGATRSGPTPHRLEVSITEFSFKPERIAVAAGDTITWINRDIVPHTVSATNGRFHSGTIAAGARWTRVLSAADTGAYLCRFHPTMRAALVGS